MFTLKELKLLKSIIGEGLSPLHIEVEEKIKTIIDEMESKESKLNTIPDYTSECDDLKHAYDNADDELSERLLENRQDGAKSSEGTIHFMFKGEKYGYSLEVCWGWDRGDIQFNDCYPTKLGKIEE
jgi:hypothetical protein